MAHSWRISRRTALRGLGVSLALPSLEIMQPAAASQPAAVPTRFACLFVPNGVYPKAWDATGHGRDGWLSPTLAPLADVQDDISVITGLDNIGRGHVQLTGAFLTGVSITNGRNAVSLDQQIAARIGSGTALPSIQLGTEPPRQGSASGEPIAFANTVSWKSETTRLSPEINPRAAFDRLFLDHSGPEAARRAARRRSVIDLALDDAHRLRRRASVADRHKIDEYLQSVRGVETQIERTLSPVAKDWTPPTQPDAMDRPPAGIPISRDQHLKMMLDLMVLAFWTDTTRVGTLMAAHGFSRQAFDFLDGITMDHHGMSHHKNDERFTSQYQTVSRWYASQLAYLLDRMKRIDEGEGSLLDHSIVLYGSSMKDGNGHRRNNLPIVLAGHGGGRLTPGRRIDCQKGTPLANLHAAILGAFDPEVESFNRVSTGAVPI